MQEHRNDHVSRRDVLGAGAALAATALTAPRLAAGVHVAGSDRIRVGLVGCGGRGTGAANNCAHAAPGVEIVALADLFPDRLRTCRTRLQDRLGDAFRVTGAHCYTGFDAYRQLLASPVDLVLFATPPAFRPIHLAEAVAQGKHVFLEKPVAVCPAGVRSVIASGERAKERGLAVVSGTQRRHQPEYLETVARIHGGAIGDVVAARCYWNQGFLWSKARQKNWSDVEWQIRNWLYFTWLSGDHIVEQHIHNLDVINWVMGGPPVKARGMGGRQVRVEPRFGQVFDHFAVDYEYANGARLTSMCRQIDGTWNQVGEELQGTKGRSNARNRIDGADGPWKYSGPRPNPYVQEHSDLIVSIRKGEPLNEARRVAETTLTAIMGRMSAYTGQVVTWDFARNHSKLDLLPGDLEFGDRPVPEVALPGRTPLV